MFRWLRRLIDRFRSRRAPDSPPKRRPVMSVEALDDDVKLVVRFTSVGQKTLRARYAKLEMVN